MLIDVVVGRVGRAHGIRGEVAIDLRTDEPERRFVVGQVLTVEGTNQELTIAGTRWHSGRLLVTFKGVPDRTAVEAFRGAFLIAAVDDAERPADDDEFYDRSLVGLVVRDHLGQERGEVTAVVHLPAQDLLAVQVDGHERLIPFATELVPTIDLTGGFVQLADRSGLLEDQDEA